MKVLEDNIEEHFYVFRLNKHFLDMTPKAQPEKKNMDKLDFNIIKNFFN